LFRLPPVDLTGVAFYRLYWLNLTVYEIRAVFPVTIYHIGHLIEHEAAL